MKKLFTLGSKGPTSVKPEEIPIKDWTSENFKQWLTDQGYDKKSVITRTCIIDIIKIVLCVDIIKIITR